MARLKAPRTAGDSKQNSRSGTAQQNQPEQGQEQRKGWPFAEGSQNHLDEDHAPWPRPSSKPGAGAPAKRPQ